MKEFIWCELLKCSRLVWVINVLVCITTCCLSLVSQLKALTSLSQLIKQKNAKELVLIIPQWVCLCPLCLLPCQWTLVYEPIEPSFDSKERFHWWSSLESHYVPWLLLCFKVQSIHFPSWGRHLSTRSCCWTITEKFDEQLMTPWLILSVLSGSCLFLSNADWSTYVSFCTWD